MDLCSNSRQEGDYDSQQVKSWRRGSRIALTVKKEEGASQSREEKVLGHFLCQKTSVKKDGPKSACLFGASLGQKKQILISNGGRISSNKNNTRMLNEI